KLEFWGKENIEPGDILLTNDGYVMGSHLNHMIFTVPVFNDGELVAFSSSMAHWPDVGGVLGGITRDIYSEGIQLPFVKIYKAGRQDPELTSIIRANVRLPERAMGDFRVQVAFKCLTTPLLLPINDGALRPVKVVLPPGRVVSATKPASMRAWMTVPMTVVDTIFKALATACPERVIAGHHCDLSSAHAYG